jgi:hypothetical protein
MHLCPPKLCFFSIFSYVLPSLPPSFLPCLFPSLPPFFPPSSLSFPPSCIPSLLPPFLPSVLCSFPPSDLPSFFPSLPSLFYVFSSLFHFSQLDLGLPVGDFTILRIKTRALTRISSVFRLKFKSYWCLIWTFELLYRIQHSHRHEHYGWALLGCAMLVLQVGITLSAEHVASIFSVRST